MSLTAEETDELHASILEAMKPGAIPPWLANIWKILGPTFLATIGPMLTQMLGPVLGPVVLQILTSLLGGLNPPPPPGRT